MSINKLHAEMSFFSKSNVIEYPLMMFLSSKRLIVDMTVRMFSFVFF